MPEVAVHKFYRRNLPVYFELEGDNGEQEFYEFKPAGRKFGAMLNAVSESVRKLLSKNK